MNYFEEYDEIWNVLKTLINVKFNIPHTLFHVVIRKVYFNSKWFVDFERQGSFDDIYEGVVFRTFLNSHPKTYNQFLTQNRELLKKHGLF